MPGPGWRNPRGDLIPGCWRTVRDLLQVKLSWLVSRHDLFFMSPMWVNEIVLQGKAHWGQNLIHSTEEHWCVPCHAMAILDMPWVGVRIRSSRQKGTGASHSMQCRAILDMPWPGVGVVSHGQKNQPEMILVESLVAIPPAMMVLPTTAAKIRHPTPPYSCLLVTTGHVGHGAPSTRCLPFTTGSMIRHREASACLPVPSSQRHASLSPRAKRSARQATPSL